MKKNCILNKKGFTLVELLVVLVILAILAAAVIPSMLGYIDKSNEIMCKVQRSTILRGWRYAKVFNEDLSLSDYYSSGDEYIAGAKCPSGGTYTINGSTVICSIHGSTSSESSTSSGSSSSSESSASSESSSSSGTSTIPNTTIPLSNTTVWPTSADYNGNTHKVIPVKAGGIFQYTDGNYYVVVDHINLTKAQAETGPGGDAYNWFATVKITMTVYTPETFLTGLSSGTTQRSDLNRGDIYQDGSDTYVFKDGGSWGYSPSETPSQWYKLP
jgi:prepilin-type N-terminal cleavage/methylation domain-containing protein